MTGQGKNPSRLGMGFEISTTDFPKSNHHALNPACIQEEGKGFPSGGKEQPSRGCAGRQVSKGMRIPSEQNAKRAGKFFGCPSQVKGLSRALIGILFLGLPHNPAQAIGVILPSTYSVTLAWNPSPSTDVIGYHLYYGTASGIYTNDIVLGNVTSVTVSGLSSGVIYYFAMTAIGPDGQESVPSNETSYRQEPPGGPQMQILGVSGGLFVLTVSGTSGHAYEIQATQDLVTWTVIGTVTLDAVGSLDFTDTNAADFPRRFYRTREIP
jgi:hypothetical protein